MNKNDMLYLVFRKCFDLVLFLRSGCWFLMFCW